MLASGWFVRARLAAIIGYAITWIIVSTLIAIPESFKRAGSARDEPFIHVEVADGLGIVHEAHVTRGRDVCELCFGGLALARMSGAILPAVPHSFFELQFAP